MSIKLTVDNNFFDNYELYSDKRSKELIKRSFVSRKLSFYPTLQLVEEVTNLYKTSRKDLLPNYANLFLDMMGYKCFNNWNMIIRGELGIIEDKVVFLNSSETVQLKKMFENLSMGKIHKNTKEALGEMEITKTKRYEFAKEIRGEHFRKIKELKIKVPKMSFEDFFNDDPAIQMRKDLTRKLLQNANKSISEEKINQIINDQVNYPYFCISQRIFLASIYKTNYLGEKVETGDVNDQHYLIYLANLDYLVSDDAGLKRLSEYIFDKEKVITFKQFLDMVKAYNFTKGGNRA